MAGTIRCARCGKSREGYVCPHCGHEKCYIKLYWQGKDYQYRHYDGGIGYGFFEAERFLNKLRSEVDDHKKKRKEFDPIRYLQSKIQELRLVTVVDKWQSENKERVRKKEFAPGSYDTYEAYRRIWCSEDSWLREKDVRDITQKDLKRFKDALPDTITITYKKKVMNGMRTFFRWMHREEIIESVPPFPSIRGDDSKVKAAITIESQDIYLSKIPEKHQDIFLFGFNTGLREGELAALKVKDINPETWVLTVQRTYSSGNVLCETTKGRHKDDIPISDNAIEICKRHIHNHPESFLFINPNTGRGYLPATIYKFWVKTGSPVCFHEAGRHSFATQIAKIPWATPQQIQKLCRHKDIRTTMKYVHMDLPDLRELVKNRGTVVSLESVREGKKINENK